MMLTGRRIVLIEDDAIMGASIHQRLQLEGADVQWLKLLRESVGALRTPRLPVDAVICDIRLPDGTGEDLFLTLCRTMVPPPFLFITGQGQTDQAVRLLHSGAVDYITKPFEMPALLSRLVQAMRDPAENAFTGTIGLSALAVQVQNRAADLADLDTPLLIRGEAGTGKARLARHLHRLSDRQAAPFVAVEPGRDDVTGDTLTHLARRAGDGILFVDGLDRLSPPMQDWLMTYLDAAPVARLIATCIPDPGDLVRPDLMARMGTSDILIPPLRDRPQDAAWLLDRLAGPMAARAGRPRPDISDLTVQAVRNHDWPGNGRELRTRLAHALSAMTGDTLFPADLFPESLSGHPMLTLAAERDRTERAHILRALERSGGQIIEAARLLDISRTTLWQKMSKHGL
ncbi:sigma-54-dependent transcriptional regulator [Paracoccus sp. Ld10]|uniref:sigma-54-dependent transcriptional regulator n=1 Tax=Paracoccus sp. Ld10 TaxID=649158 RepID=UPI00386B8DB4